MNPLGTIAALHFSHWTNIFAALSGSIDLAIKNLMSVGSPCPCKDKPMKYKNLTESNTWRVVWQRYRSVYLRGWPKLLNWYPHLGQCNFMVFLHVEFSSASLVFRLKKYGFELGLKRKQTQGALTQFQKANWMVSIRNHSIQNLKIAFRREIESERRLWTLKGVEYAEEKWEFRWQNGTFGKEVKSRGNVLRKFKPNFFSL